MIGINLITLKSTMKNYPLQKKKTFYTADKNIYYFFSNKKYQVDVSRKINNEKIRIRRFDIENINDARIIRNFIIKYLESMKN